MTKIKVGDVFSIQTNKGKAYLHCAHLKDGEEYIRVLSGYFDLSFNDMDYLSTVPEKIIVRFPVEAAFRKGIISKEGHIALIPTTPQYSRYPNILNGKFRGWRIVEEYEFHSKRIPLIEKLSSEQLRFSPSGLFTDKSLLNWLEQDLTLADWTTEYVLNELQINGKSKFVKVKTGDIFSIDVLGGKSFLHYIRDIRGKELIRVLDGVFPEDFNQLEALVQTPERFMVGFPVSSAYRFGLIKLVGFASAAAYQPPAIMRSWWKRPDGSIFHYTIDTETLKRTEAHNLTPEFLRLSPHGTWNDTLLVQRIANDWKLEDWK